jgi:hypothetical protein
VIESRIIGSRPRSLLAEPANFLHSIDIEADRAIFFPTSRDLLSGAAFIDGRSAIATGAPDQAQISQLIRYCRPQPTPDRFIFHLSFCGSTLISRLLDVPGHSLVLKEPNCLVDIATWKTLNQRAGKPLERLDPALQLARSALSRPWALGELVTVKPSSWVNNLLDELTAEPNSIRPLFITIEPDAFLRAVLRGGTDRLTFTAQLAWHLASGFPEGDRILQLAVEAADDPLGRAANLSLVAYHLQMAIFDRVTTKGDWGQEHRLDMEEISASPREAAVKANRALSLGLEPEDLERTAERHANSHSKNPAIGYSADQRRTDDETVIEHHESTIEAALDWAKRSLPLAVPA